MSRDTRRNFLKSAGSLAAAGAAPAAPKKKKSRASGFAPTNAPRKLTENLYLFEDTCNVYIVRDGASCVLIDFGSGKVLDHLRDLGVNKVDWVMHTHHHRDQCQGDSLAVERNIPIAVPAHERHLFEDAENFWRNRRVYHLYYVRNDFNTITENVRVERSLFDYSTFRWGKTDFFVLPTPGHTLGSITLVASIDGKRVAFSGDLMYAPGKIVNLYDTQVNYGGTEGIDLGSYALMQLEEQKPELLCPSHGEPLNDPGDGIRKTRRKLVDYLKFQGGVASVENRPYAVSPHLVANFQTTSSFYAIVSNSGKAMFIDYGSASSLHFNNFEVAAAPTQRMRFVEHTIGDLKRDFGVKSVDVAMPSHMHDDHMNGFPHLQRHHGANVWCLENMVDIFQNPRGHNLGCILGEPFQVSRSFRPGERFKWEEFEFEITHSPGHTEYQMALFVTIDGQRVAFTGDALFASGKEILRHNLIFRNHVENDSHLKSIRNLIAHEPTLLCPGHGKPYPVDQSILLATEQDLRKQQRHFFDLLPDGEVDFGLDPSWVRIYPYQSVVEPGGRQALQIHVQNYKASPMKMEVSLVAPAEWSIEPDVLKFEAPARSVATQTFQVSIPKSWTPHSQRFAIAADVVRDRKYLGQITEAVVEVARGVPNLEEWPQT
jgi:glyoxylase-like metal-dependent hydrolase (beta-lactamase superfamily II)